MDISLSHQCLSISPPLSLFNQYMYLGLRIKKKPHTHRLSQGEWAQLWVKSQVTQGPRGVGVPLSLPSPGEGREGHLLCS